MIFFFECFEQSQKKFFEVLILRGSKGAKIHFLFLGGFFLKKGASRQKSDEVKKRVVKIESDKFSKEYEVMDLSLKFFQNNFRFYFHTLAHPIYN